MKTEYEILKDLSKEASEGKTISLTVMLNSVNTRTVSIIMSAVVAGERLVKDRRIKWATWLIWIRQPNMTFVAIWMRLCPMLKAETIIALAALYLCAVGLYEVVIWAIT